MPVYEYECDVCGMRFEVHRHFGEPHPTVCPAGHEDTHRVFSPPTIIFRGSGFYVTDNGRNGCLTHSLKDKQKKTDPVDKSEKQVEQQSAVIGEST
jgi:putative FmdB family regulatory protein